MPECKNCFNGCPQITYDECVKYTGDNVDELSICNGDYLSTVLPAIINEVLGFSDGTGITLTVDTSCSYFSSIFGAQDKTISNLISSLISGECGLKTSIDALNTQINNSFSFNTGCLTLPVNPTRDDILQATIAKVCSIDTRVTAIENDYVKASQLDTLIQQYIDSINTTTTIIQQSTKLSPYIAYEYYGPLTNFDGTGKGLASTGYDKVYICNGNNGTPDKRGRVAVGVNVGVPGGAMDSAVDPAVAGNYQVTLKGKLGEFKHTNTLVETAVHTHTIDESPHSHSFPHQWNEDGAGHIASGGRIDEGVIVDVTAPALTNITINPAGGGQPHNNTQPSIGANFIIYLP